MKFYKIDLTSLLLLVNMIEKLKTEKAALEPI